MKKGLIVLGVIVTFIVLSVLGFVCQWTGEATDVIYQEVRPAELQRKYEWFKNVAAKCDAKLATLHAFETSKESLREDYGEPKEWPRDVRADHALAKQETLGIKASYNLLASDYNAQMSKWNWQFCNVGTLPEGATEPLPREFKPYLEK